METITSLQVSRIKAGNNDRKNFNRRALEELATSIAEHGLAQPITVRPTGDGIYEIVAGERRFRAISQVLGWDRIPCIIRELTDEESSAIMLVENTSRADLDPMEEAQAYQTRRERHGWDFSRIAKVAGVSEELVRRRINLLNLVDEAQNLVANGHLPIGHAELLASLDSNRQRIAMRIYSESESMSYRVFRGVVNQLLEEQTQGGLFDLENFWITQVQQGAEIPTRGKRAIVDVSTNPHLPSLSQPNGKASASETIKAYIQTLEANGFTQEAAAIGTLYSGLVHLNFMAAC